MAESAPGLRLFFASTRPVRLLQAVFEKTAKIDFDWKIPDNFEDRLCLTMQAYAKSNEPGKVAMWNVWCSAFFNITSVLHHYHKDRNCTKLQELLRMNGLYATAIKYLGREHCTARNLISWIYAYGGDLWEEMLNNAEVLDISASGGAKYYITPICEPRDEQFAFKAFKDKFLELMQKEATFIDNIHIEKNDLNSFRRYIMHIPPFPHEVAQFKQNKLVSGLDANANCFSIVFSPLQNFFKIKCSFSASQKDKIAEYFAAYILGASIKEKPKEKYDLDSINREYRSDFRFSLPGDDSVLAARACFIKVGINKHGKQKCEEISHGIPTGSIFEASQSSLVKYPIASRTRLELQLEVTIRTINRILIQGDLFSSEYEDIPCHTYKIKITPGQWSSNCNDPEEEAVLRRFCEHNRIVNLAGKSHLKPLTRK